MEAAAALFSNRCACYCSLFRFDLGTRALSVMTSVSHIPHESTSRCKRNCEASPDVVQGLRSSRGGLRPAAGVRQGPPVLYAFEATTQGCTHTVYPTKQTWMLSDAPRTTLRVIDTRPPHRRTPRRLNPPTPERRPLFRRALIIPESTGRSKRTSRLLQGLLLGLFPLSKPPSGPSASAHAG